MSKVPLALPPGNSMPGRRIPHLRRTLGLLGLLFLGVSRLGAVQEICTDICVYGGTSGGVIAAVQAARLGKSVSLVVVNNHLGGMTSGGLGATDIGRLGNGYIQGLAREFYTRVGQKYGAATAVFAFEPGVAETVFKEMVQEAGVKVYTNQQLVSVLKHGTHIIGITMNNSNLFRAKMFIDATYEGDLMAKAGVSYTIKREAVAQYGESSNGIRPAANSFGSLAVDPYEVPGNPASGLLPLLQPGELGTVGEADQRLQAFNYRMCLTTNVLNRIPITAPPGYNPAQYELLGRYVQGMTAAGTTMTLSTFMSIAQMPNGKTDVNNGGAISTDFVGESAAYPEAGFAQRQQIELAHKNYIMGLFYFLGNDSRVPVNIRTQMLAYGYAKDEFTDTGGWPHQLYVREARRMVSDFVMTQAHMMSTAVAPDSVGLGAYVSDQHSCGRLVLNGVVVKLPGGGLTPPKLYPISYRSLVPKAAECTNLLVPWSVSVSHVVFCSLRMEPVFMVLSQSAGTAASMAIDDQVSVQTLSFPKLQAQLLADGQALGPDTVLSAGDYEVIIDNAEPDRVNIVGDWLVSSSTEGYYGGNYLHDRNANKGSSSVTFTPVIKKAGTYEVALRWTSYANRAPSVPVYISHPGGSTLVTVDQTQRGGEWVTLLVTNFASGTSANLQVRNAGTTGYVIADAARFRPVDYRPEINVWAGQSVASRYGLRPGKITISRSGVPETALTIHLNVGGSALNGGDYETLPTQVTLPAGVSFTNLLVQPRTNALPVGDKTVVVALVTNAAYSNGPLASATCGVQDSPINQWRLKHFQSNAANPGIAGDGANPAGDGIPNLVKYALGLDPNVKHLRTVVNPGLDSSGRFTFSFTRPDPPPIDIAYAVEGSSTLLPWSPQGDLVLSALVLNTNGTAATVTFTEASPALSRPHSFDRVGILRK